MASSGSYLIFPNFQGKRGPTAHCAGQASLQNKKKYKIFISKRD